MCVRSSAGASTMSGKKTSTADRTVLNFVNHRTADGSDVSSLPDACRSDTSAGDRIICNASVTNNPVAGRYLTLTRTRPFMGAGRESADDRTAIGQFENSFWVERQIVNRTTTGRCSDGYRRNIDVAPQESRKVLINRTSIWRASAGLLAGIGRTPQGKRAVWKMRHAIARHRLNVVVGGGKLQRARHGLGLGFGLVLGVGLGFGLA
ncbi:hypothetical protein DPMN_107300 [Dreissena polymorpha]|uniref:Uncharacterized protein n=1 Tax=Dreissena polymorpha TaxID=45954 RepID=A0A9D4K6W6_DREPO|nr:hypothetical protein DPMN_107300 [Dreissena polymorpha]